MVLRERGHRVSCVTLTDGPRTERRDGLVRFPRAWPWPWRAVVIAAWMWRHRSSYDVVYATGLHTEATIGCRLSRRPLIVKIVGDPAWERSVRQGLTDLGFDEFQRARSRGLRVRLMRALRTSAVRRADAVVVPSEHLRAAVEAWGAVGVVVIANGVRLPAGIATRGRGGTDDAVTNPLRAITVSRLVAHKNIDTLIDAAAQSGIALDVVGDGPDRARLQDVIEKADAVDHVRILGDRSHDDALARIARADVFVLASRYEGLPHAVIEALAVGTPVVSAPVGGVAEAVTDGVDGVIVDPPTVDEFVDALTRLRDDREMLAALTTGAMESGARWRFDRCADEIEAVLERVVGPPITNPRPGVVFLGKTEMPRNPGPDLRRKLALHRKYLRQVSINVAPLGTRRVEGVTVVGLPSIRPRPVGSAAFYTAGPLLAVAIATVRRWAIVCQSPFEAVGVMLLTSALPRRWRPAVQVELHGDWRTGPRLYGHPLRRLAGPASDRASAWAVRRADRLRVVSERLEELALDSGYRGPMDRFVTFSDFAAFLDRPPVAAPSRPQALFAGVLEPYKAVDVLLDAWPDVLARVPDAHLKCVGNGSRRDDLLARSRDAELQGTVAFIPAVPRDELSALIDGSTCLVLPSRSEGLARIVLEAMARGRPVVASDVGGIREVLDDGVQGRIVSVEDAAALADALVAVLGDPERAAAMGAAARATAEARDPVAEYAAGIERMAAWLSVQAAARDRAGR